MVVCRVPIQVMKSLVHLAACGCPDAHAIADNAFVQLFYYDGHYNEKSSATSPTTWVRQGEVK